MAMQTAASLKHANISDLPDNLRLIAQKGFNFSTSQKLVVYTDGSGLGNGQRGARAGLGVWWGATGDAERCNLYERVPGALQTNNRGELLVSSTDCSP